MDISEVKEDILRMYNLSLRISSKFHSHPIRIVQAVKSIIGINRKKPLENILCFCDNYIKQFKNPYIVNQRFSIVEAKTPKIPDACCWKNC